MEIIEFIIVFFIALIIGSVFFYGLNRRGPWGAFWVFLLILVLAAWAGRLWIAPAGPVIWGYAWLPVVFWVLFIALLIGAVSSPTEDRTVDYEPDTKTEIDENDIAVTAVFGLFFWLLLILLAVAIIVGLFR